MAEKVHCFALRLPTGPGQSPAVCQETGISGNARRAKCPIASSTTQDCFYAAGKPVPKAHLVRWREILAARAKAEQQRQG